MADEKTNLTPTFIVYLNGTRLSAAMESDVREITVIDRVDMPSSCTLTMSDLDRKWVDHGDFSIGTEMKIMLGYKDEVEEVFIGKICGAMPSYRQNSDGLIVLRGNNDMHLIYGGKKTLSFSEKTDKEIVEQVAKDAGLKTDIEEIGATHKFTMQRNQSDYEYLMQMARKFNCKAWISKGTLFVKKIEDKSEDEVILEWGKTLIEFVPSLDVNGLITEVEVHGWDRLKNEAIIGTATVGDIGQKVGGNTLGGKLRMDNISENKEIIIDESIIDKDGADEAALGRISENSMNYINGSGTTQGNHKIKAGMVIEIKEIGKKYSGKYYLTGVNHRFIANKGFTTSFDVLRNAAD